MARSTQHQWFSLLNDSARRRQKRAFVCRPLERRLWIEPLEDRRLLSITVDSFLDVNDSGDGLTTLREAITAAPLGETINFAPSLTSEAPATIQLTIVGHLGDITINKSLTIEGPGADLLMIRAYDPTPDVKIGDGNRVFTISDGSSRLSSVTISGLTLTGGDTSGAGGAIFVRENLTIVDTVITGNATTSGQIAGGGGIYSNAGSSRPNSLTVLNSSITGNSAANFEGGGIRKRYGTLVIDGSTIDGNSALEAGGGVSAADQVNVQIINSVISNNSATGTFSSFDGGGGVFLYRATTSIMGSTISGNTMTNGDGGGIYNYNGSLSVAGSTVSGNSARFEGGGVFSFGSLNVTESSISGNSATYGSGGGVFHSGLGSNLTIAASTISDNSARSSGGGVSGYGNLSVTDSSISGNSSTYGSGGGVFHSGYGNNLTISASTISYNSARSRGGGIYTFGSLNVTDSTISGNSVVDSGGGGIFTGAFGSNVTFTSSTISGNSANGNYGSGGGIYSFSNQLNLIDSVVSYNSAGAGGGIQSRYLTVTGSVISGNSARTDGGGIFNPYGSVTVSGSSIRYNSAQSDGGGIYQRYGSLTITGSTLSGNSANGGSGGAIRTRNSVLSLVNSTISGNHASGTGGGLYLFSYGTANPAIRHSTISYNSAGTFGGGIVIVGGTLALSHTIVARNFATFGPDLTNLFGVVNAQYALIGNNSGSGLATTTFGTPDANGNLIGPVVGGEPLSVYVEMAAMGDFEAGPGGDSFLFEYSIDGGAFRPLFTINVDESTSQTYFMDQGTQVVLDDPLVVDGVVLNKYFQGFSALIPASSGQIKIRFTSTNDGPTEAFAWRNLFVFGQNSGSFVGSAVTFDVSGDSYAAFASDPDYTISGDMFGVRSRLVPGTPSLPRDIVDSSLVSVRDIQGIISEFDSGRFFGVVDTVNGIGSDTNMATFTFNNVAQSIDPLLAPLTENAGRLLPDGSRLLSHALLPGSLAIDAGNPAAVAGVSGVPQFDQRSYSPFTRVADGDGSGGPRIDIGAVEQQSLHLVVDTLTDEDDGNFSAGNFSLREAIGLANSNVANDQIGFAPALAGGTIQLTLGEISLTDSTTIAGPGADLLTVKAFDTTPETKDGGGNRVFNIFSAGFFFNALDVEISGLTLTGGDTFSGGGIFNQGNLVIKDTTITGNSALFSGGGIDHRYGTLTVIDSLITGNSAGGYFGGGGGGIYSRFGYANITGTTVSGNTADYHGGGVRSNYSAVTLSNSVISGNTAGGDGGGLYGRRGTLAVRDSAIRDNIAGESGGGIGKRYGSLDISGSTISGNSSRLGGGITISSDYASVSLVNSTVSGNSATFGGGGLYWFGSGYAALSIRHTTIANNGSRFGGGIFAAVGTVELENSLVAQNFASVGSDITGLVGFSVDPRFSLIGNGANSGLTEAPIGAADSNGNLIGGPINGVINPGITTLAENSGPLLPDGSHLMTHSLFASSPAIDAGDPAAVAGVDGVPDYDQRGAPFARITDGNADGSARIDMGAVEPQSLTFIVDTLVDEDDGDHSTGDLSLREAIAVANANIGGVDKIMFDPALAGGTILLGQGQIYIDDAVRIVGPGDELLTVKAFDPTPSLKNGDGTRVFEISYLASDVMISGLTITGGDIFSSGGGILNSANLTLIDTTISGNSAAFGGGGVYVPFAGSVVVTDSTITGNSTRYGSGGGMNVRYGNTTIANSTIGDNTATYGWGGGISQSSGNLTVTGSTIRDNIAINGDGGGMHVRYGNTTIANSTISGNSSGFSGGGINVRFSTATVLNSTISGNSANYRGGGIYNGSYSTLTVSHTTITANTAINNGGGIMAAGNESLSHTIVAGNTRGAMVRNDVSSSVSLDFSLLGVNTGAIISNNGGNLIGTSTSPINPLLGPLADNGGLTRTHALLAGSSAIDAGNASFNPNAFEPPLVNDQRGSGFARVGGERIDIGAFELQPALAPWSDFDGDGDVDGRDFLLWQLGHGLVATATHGDGDADNDQDVDNTDLDMWQLQYGATATVAAYLSQESSSASQESENSSLLSTLVTPLPINLTILFYPGTVNEADGSSPLTVDLALEQLTVSAPRSMVSVGARLGAWGEPPAPDGSHEDEVRFAAFEAFDEPVFEM